MDQELAKYHDLNTSLTLEIQELQAKYRTSETELTSLRTSRTRLDLLAVILV